MPRRRNRRKKQKGGRVVMPSRYFNADNRSHYFTEGSPELTLGASPYGEQFPTSTVTPIGNRMLGPDLGVSNSSLIKTAGQAGGRTVMPMRYFSPNNRAHYFTAGSPELTIGNHPYGQSHAVSHGIPIGNNYLGPDLGVTNHSNIQTAGSMFNRIVNPETGRKVSIYGKIGKKVIKNYIKYLNN